MTDRRAIPPRTRVRLAVFVAALLAPGVALAGCALAASTHGAPTAIGSPVPGVAPLGHGFLGDSGPTPTPEATVEPEPGSWAGVVPPSGYRVVLITAGDDPASTAVADGVRVWAARTGVALDERTAVDDDGVEARIEEAVALAPDLVVGAGAGVVDVFALLTAQHLGQQFLVVGAQLAEPTENVTSVIWDGAAFRGTGLAAASEPTAEAITPARASDAIEAGVASVLHGHTGIVLHLSTR
ncbi:BMP family ABC transporter substrate-binding protein [Agromyces intestinalis]|uniref:BMP family ABC transporter substrate-binding protein n=1 Tax=Agromyces intestinalis TaxID=2592652 RepID=A0A5C1YFR0_9MICO|nr:BMP family ABC transporter substrate-binding protein [Agromyces intestinalis]QEO14893.1 BMP family ABC transporter substrate-binding protein [Agromyces intestinalis]